MTRAGLPVPPGLVVTTEACNAFFENDKNFPEGMWDQVQGRSEEDRGEGRQAFRRSEESVAGFSSIGRCVLDARDDGYSSQPRV